MMLPSVPKSLGRLSDVFISALGSITGKDNRLGLPRAKNACVVLVDGLGSFNLEYRAGHAPTLSSALKKDGSITVGFPSTTVSSLASFATGARPGSHGMVGYQVFDRKISQAKNLLTGIVSMDEALDWQRSKPVASKAIEDGVEAFFVGPFEYENSGFTMATMRGAKYLPAKNISDRFTAAGEILSKGGPSLVYLYVPELDQNAHAHGFKSAKWVEKLEDLEAGLKGLISKLPKNSGVLLTADHGIVDVNPSNHIYLDALPIKNLRSVGGDPRVLFLYFDSLPDNETISSIQEFVGKRAYVATKTELIEAGWFGQVENYASERMPELFIISISECALYHRHFAKAKSLQMIGQHGSISTEELKVPLLKFGAFANS